MKQIEEFKARLHNKTSESPDQDARGIEHAGSREIINKLKRRYASQK